MSPGTTYLRRAVASAVLVAVIFAVAPERAATQGRALFPETSSLFVERSVTGSYRLALPEGYVDLTESGIGWFRYETSSQTGLHLSWKLVGMQTQSRWMIGGGAADDPQLTRIDASGSQRLRAGRSAVRAGILPGIDLHIASVANGQQGGEGLFKYSFLVAPRVDPGSIVIDADAGVRPHRDDQGRLLFTTPLGTITEDPPVGWQNVDGVRRYVPIAFVVDGTILDKDSSFS